ncbi:MAG: DUF4810 domain-containing protein [Acidobacteria bacterium]|nr:MAG: DUF4810 domain-containing protein [Acidobacteriota bacterium]
MAATKSARPLTLVAAIAMGSVLVGCAPAPKRLYHWEAFQDQLYEYFRADRSGPEEQLRILGAQVEKARARGAALPPGFRAHLAMLYLRLGRDGEAKQELEAEKLNFPESTQYMDFLLKRMTAPKT